MYFADLQEFIAHLEMNGELVRVEESVDPYLEVASVVTKICKSPARNTALLFENVRGSALPLVVNSFGSLKRTVAALGVDNLQSVLARLKADIHTSNKKESGQALAELIQARAIGQLANIEHLPSLSVEAPKGLLELPVLHSWPKDGGAYITLGQTFTQHPETKKQNCGMYRLQVVDAKTALIKFHPGSGGGAHLQAWHATGQAMPLAVVLGGPPALTWCAGLSLPAGITEPDFVNYLTGQKVAMAQCQNSELFVPASAEVVIEGLISPGDVLDEGPFGNHTGYYSEVAPAPVVKVQNVYMRESALYPCTVVGPPPMENSYLARVNERILLVLLQYDLPWVIDVHMPIEGIYHRAALVAVDEYSLSAAEISEKLCNTRLLRNSRLIVLLDKACDLQNFRDVYWRIINADGWERTVSIDGNKMIIDARTSTRKIPMPREPM